MPKHGNWFQGYHSKSSLLRKSKDQIEGSVGPGHPVKIPAGITKSQRKKSKAKRWKDDSLQKLDTALGRKGHDYRHLTDHIPALKEGPSKEARRMWHRSKKKVGRQS